MKSKWIKRFVLFLWFVLSVIFIICGIELKIKYMSMLVLGAVLSFLGIGRVFQNVSGCFLFDVGIGCMLTPMAQILGISNFNTTYTKEIVIFFGMIIAAQLFFDDAIRTQKARKRCTAPYEAKCISFTQAANSTYIPVYKYQIEGKTAMYYGNGSTNVNPKLGDIITVFVNKKNEKEVYCPTSKAILMLRYLIGATILAFSTGAVIVL